MNYYLKLWRLYVFTLTLQCINWALNKTIGLLNRTEETPPASSLKNTSFPDGWTYVNNESWDVDVDEHGAFIITEDFVYEGN